MDITVTIATNSGPLSLNEAPYRLAAGTFETVAVTHRRAEVTNPFLEGSYVVNAPRENVVVPLAVWVEADTRAALMAARTALTDALDQVTFSTYVTIDGETETWWCSASDYTVSSPRELMFATRCKVEAQLVRHPSLGG